MSVFRASLAALFVCSALLAVACGGDDEPDSGEPTVATTPASGCAPIEEIEAFALSAWGALQNCAEVDTSAIRPFVEHWYASPKSGESALACEGGARRLPPC